MTPEEQARFDLMTQIIELAGLKCTPAGYNSTPALGYYGGCSACHRTGGYPTWKVYLLESDEWGRYPSYLYLCHDLESCAYLLAVQT